ncbi:MAG: hypothetical protein ABSE58_11845 [Candidatus Limnocylindrales bacterium]
MTIGGTPALVVSGHTMALAVVRALGEAGVPVTVLHYDARDMAQASRYVVADVRIPHPLYDEAGFVAALVEEARQFGGSILIPASDESVVGVSRNRDVLAQYCTVACPEWAIAQRFIDKAQTYALADAHGIAAPRTLVPRSLEELESQAQSIGFPLLLKPAESHLFYERFKTKMVRADTMAALKTSYGEAVEAGLAVMLQELIPGDDSAVVNYNAYVWDGKPVAEFTARQLRKAPPAFGSPRVAISERIPEVIEPGRKILAAMEFHGFACTEFKLDPRDGVYKLMEVNGRHNLSGLLAVRCGVNFPLMQYQHLAEGVMPSGGAYRSGIYWTDVVRDAGYSLAYLRSERHTPVEYLAPYARRHCDAIFDRRDMGPFWVRLRSLLSIAGRTARMSLSHK